MFIPTEKILFICLLTTVTFCGLWQVGHGAYIHAKAILAQLLLESAWSETLSGAREVKPWPWADTWPVSRLAAPRLGISRIVLAGASGASLAFGPGHLFGTAPTDQAGNSVIAGHRDTHFRFLQYLTDGDVLLLETSEGKQRRYQVTHTRVIHESEIGYLQQTRENRLTLITCFPFNSPVAGGAQRYIVIAREIEKADGIDSGAIIAI